MTYLSLSVSLAAKFNSEAGSSPSTRKTRHCLKPPGRHPPSYQKRQALTEFSLFFRSRSHVGGAKVKVGGRDARAPGSHTQVGGGQKARRAAGLGGLLERVGQLDQRRFAVGPAKEGNAYRHAKHKPQRNVDVGISRHRCRTGAPAGVVVPVHQVDEPSRAARGRYKRIEVQLVHDRVDALGPRKAAIFLERLQILLAGERPLLDRLEKNILAKVRHLLRPIPFVEPDNLLQRTRRGAGTQFAEIGVQVSFE